MISDQIILGSHSTYLRNSAGSVNLAQSTGIEKVRTPRLSANQIWNISGIELLIEADDLEALVHLPDTLNTPLMEIKTQKEIFPLLFANPYETRVHNIAGFQDFESGKAVDCFVTEVNNLPTLVSKDSDECQWESMVYKLPQTISLFAASWELATSRLVNDDQFEYNVQLRLWQDHNVSGVADHIINLTQDSDANDQRLYNFDSAQQQIDCQAFQLEFTATVNVNSPFYESHRIDFDSVKSSELQLGESIGMPLLRSIRLLEKVESDYSFYSLHELIQRAGFHQMFDPLGGNFYRLLINLDVPVTLVGRKHTLNSNTDDYEYLQVAISSAAFNRVQLRLNISEQLKIQGMDRFE